MFLTRACEIIYKEGFRTFIYALGQKMRQNMSEDESYEAYIKKIEPMQRIKTEKSCVGVVDFFNESTIADVLDAVKKCSAEFVAIKDSDIQICEDYSEIVSHYILIQKKAGRNLDYIYSDSDSMTREGRRISPDCKPDYSWDTLLSFNYIGRIFVARKGYFLNQMNNYIEKFGSDKRFVSYRISLYLLESCKAERVGHIHQILGHEKDGYKPDEIESSDIIDYKALLPTIADIGARIIADRNTAQIQHVHYPISNNDMVSIIIPSKDNPDILKICLNSIKKYTTDIQYEIIVIDNGSNNDNRAVYEKMIDAFGEKASYTYDTFEFNFSRMCNMGAKKARGNLLLFLNDDIEVAEQDYSDADWLSVLAGQAKQRNAGAIGAKLLYPGSKYIQHIGVVNYESSCFAHLYAKAVDDNNIKAYRNRADYDCLCVTGACFMMTKQRFEQIGGFDEELTVTHNDVDVCLSLYERGFVNILRNDVVLYHHESFSRGDDEIDEAKNRLNMRARDITYTKHPLLEKYDPFYNPLLTQEDNDYRFGKEIYSVIYNKPVKEVRPVIADKDELADTVRITQMSFHDDLSIRGFAYKGNRVYYNPVILLYNDKYCYKVKSKSLCDRVFHLRKGEKNNINYAPFYCGVDTTDMNSGAYSCAIQINNNCYDTGWNIELQ